MSAAELAAVVSCLRVGVHTFKFRRDELEPSRGEANLQSPSHRLRMRRRLLRRLRLQKTCALSTKYTLTMA